MRESLSAMLRSTAREPLVHFLIAGLAIFMISGWRETPVDPASRTITITPALVAHLSESFAQTWQRAPTRAEIDELIRDHVQEEIYYREAIRLGLDRDDAVVRRRLRTKMESLAAAQLDSETPDTATLQRWLDEHPGRFSANRRISFDQIYFNASDETAARARAARLLARLNSGADWQNGNGQASGDAISLPASLDSVTARDVVRQFGEEFTRSVSSLPVGRWSGPLASGYGLHLVRLRALDADANPALADVRREVENDWRAATRATRQATAYRNLLLQYDVRTETR